MEHHAMSLFNRHELLLVNQINELPIPWLNLDHRTFPSFQIPCSILTTPYFSVPVAPGFVPSKD